MVIKIASGELFVPGSVSLKRQGENLPPDCGFQSNWGFFVPGL